VSAASLWEVAIKRNSGKLKAPDNLLDKIAQARFEELRIDFRHAISCWCIAFPPPRSL
jgi:PIN domain nuclease of toxin-antitoxin system